MSRIMALDYGMKRTGIAVTDPLKLIVNPLTVTDTSALFEYLEGYFKEEEVEELVIGEARGADGSISNLEVRIREFINRINKKYPDMIISRQDESLTSSEAKDLLVKMGMKKKKRQEKGMLDKVSAVLILQRYLNHI